MTQVADSRVIKELILKREFDAPREIVFKAWIDPTQLQKWWSPKHFTNGRCEFDARPGGNIHIDMIAPDGTVYPMGGTVKEVDEPNKLVFLTTAHFGGKGTEPDLEVLNTVEFAEVGHKTIVKLRASVLKASDNTAFALAGMDEGWSTSLDKLRSLVLGDTSDREIMLSRAFDAPRELVFDAYIDPELLQHWWGPQGFSITTFEHDARPGGTWRLAMRGPDGKDYHNRIVYTDVERAYRLAYRHVPSKETEPVTFDTTITFERCGDGKTEVTVLMLFPSANAREHVAKTYNAVEGLNQTLDRLGAYLSQIRLSQEAKFKRSKTNGNDNLS